jgi:hypothetical protein
VTAFAGVRFRSKRGVPGYRHRRLYSARMSNHAPLHLFEIFFYSTSVLLAAIGVMWLLLH